MIDDMIIKQLQDIETMEKKPDECCGFHDAHDKEMSVYPKCFFFNISNEFTY